MNGDRTAKMSSLARGVKYRFDCIFRYNRVTSEDKRWRRRMIRRMQKRELYDE